MLGSKKLNIGLLSIGLREQFHHIFLLLKTGCKQIKLHDNICKSKRKFTKMSEIFIDQLYKKVI